MRHVRGASLAAVVVVALFAGAAGAFMMGDGVSNGAGAADSVHNGHGGTVADSAFAALQERGASMRGMGVDQYTSTHRFDVLTDGGRIELQRDVEDPDGVARSRRHLQEIARAFRAGDFSTPAFVHMQRVPGTDVMAARASLITYEYRDLPRGGEVRITTGDSAALDAIRRFMEFQRHDHRAGGAH